MASKKRRYSGVLIEKISPNPPFEGLLNTTSTTDHIRNEYWIRLNALFDFFKIGRQDPNRWSRLAFALAVEHVPGMNIAKTRNKRRAGQPRRWDIQEKRRLVKAVDEKNASQRARNISAAVRTITKSDPSFKGVKGLETRYHEAKKAIAASDKKLAEAIEENTKWGEAWRSAGLEPVLLPPLPDN
jgi:hypothetical protein